MSLNFPPSANTGDIYTSGNASYEFTGTKWKPVNRVDYTVQASDIAAANNELVIDFDVDGIQRLTLSEEADVIFVNSPAEGEYKKVLLDLTANTSSTYDDFVQLDINEYFLDEATGNVQIGSGGTFHILWGKDGYRLYGMDQENDARGVHQYDLTIPYDLSTISYVSSIFITSSGSTVRGGDIKPDGTALYVIDGYGGFVFIDMTSSPWDFGTRTAIDYDISNYASVYRIRFGDSGNKLYAILKTNPSTIRQYDLNGPWDLTGMTTSRIADYEYTLQDTDATDFYISENGDKFWTMSQTEKLIREYSITNWEMSTAQYTGKSLSVGGDMTTPHSIEFANGKMHVTDVGTATDTVYQYTTAGTFAFNTITWPSNIEWEDGTPPSLPALTETALIEIEARTDYLSTNYIGRLVGRNF